MRHSQFKKLIDKYLASELPEDVQASFEEHMLDCESCKEKLMLSQAVVDGLADIKTPEKDTAISFIQRLKILIITALHPLYYPVPAGVTLILLIAVGLSVFFKMPNPPLDQPVLSFIGGFFDPKPSEKVEVEDKTTISYWLNQYRELNTSDPRSRMVHNIFNRLVQVADHPGSGIPKLVILKGPSENLIFSLSDSHIILSEGVIEKCRGLLKDPEYVKAALAFILGHELAHQFNGDYWGHRLKEALGFREDLPKHLRSRLKDLAKAQEAAYYIRTQELKADTKGILTASLAGYDVSLLLEEDGFINQWARSTSISSDKTHPAPKQRQEAIKTLLFKVQKEAHSFYLGVRLAQIGRYSEAIQALERFSIYYPGREVFTNLGVACHLWALSISDPHADPNKPIYKRSLTMEPVLKAFPVRDYADKDLCQEKLDQALIYYRKALNADPQNPVVWHNLACCLADKEENLDLALGHITQAILLDPDYYQAYNTRGTIYMNKGMVNKASEDFNKAKSYENYSDPFYNLAILAKQKVQYLKNLEAYLNLDSTGAWADRLIRKAEDLDLGEADLIKRVKKDIEVRKTFAFSLQEQIEGKGVSDTKQSFNNPNDPNSWGDPDETYEIALSEGKAEVWIYKRDTKGIKVCFIDKQVVFIEAGYIHKGKSFKGVGIEDALNIIYEKYGSPQKVFWCIGRQILVYPMLGIGFEIEGNKVRGWFLFDKSYF